MKQCKETPNYDIMFKSAVSMLQTTYKAYINIQREKFDYMHRGCFDSEGCYCITVNSNDEVYRKSLDERERLLAQQLQFYIGEVERLRKLKNESS